MLSVLTVINNLTESSTATLTLSSHVIVTETHSQWHHSTAHILIDTNAHAHTHTHMHAHTQTHTKKHSQRNHNMLDQVQSPFISILTLLRSKGRDLGDRSTSHFLDISNFADHKWRPAFNVFKHLPPASAGYKCCHVFADDDKSHLHIYICLLITSDILRFLDYKHCPSMFVSYACPSVCWIQVLSSYIGWLHWLLSSYVCWLQVTSSCFLIKSIVLQCLLVTRVVLQCSLVTSIVLLCLLVTNVVLLCLLTSAVLCFLTTSVVLCLLITSAVLCLLIKSAVLSLLIKSSVLCLLITSSVLCLLITSTVLCLLITSAVLRWLITSAILNSYACWVQVSDNKCCPPM